MSLSPTTSQAAHSSGGVTSWVDERSREAGSLAFAGVVTHRVSGLTSRFLPIAPLKFLAGSRFIAPFALAGIGVMAWSSVRASQRYFGGSSQDRWHDGIQIFSAALAVGAIFGGAFRKMVPGFRLVHSAMVFGGLALDLVDLGHLTLQWREDSTKTSSQEILLQAGLICLFGVDRETIQAGKELLSCLTWREWAFSTGALGVASASFLLGSPETAAGSLVLGAVVGPGFFRPDSRIGPNTVLFIDNRPAGPHLYHRLVREAYERVQLLEGGEVPADLPLEFITDPGLRHLIDKGLREGDFKDTTKVNDWLVRVNAQLGIPARIQVPPLRLSIAHAESHIDPILREVVTNQHYPAGVVLSGSPKMLSEVHHTDPVVRKTIEFVQHLLAHDVPVLGICFGMQLMAFARYGALVEWMTIPEGAHLRVIRHERPKLSVPVTPGTRQMIFGSWMVRAASQEHPLLRHTGHVRGIKVHSQAIRFPHENIPEEMVLATSSRRYRTSRSAPADRDLKLDLVEVLECGPYAYGTQLHPELTPDLLYALTFMPKFRDALVTEGHDLEVVREGLRGYPKGFNAGQRYGYNWAKYILMHSYLERQVRRTKSQRLREACFAARDLLERTNTPLYHYFTFGRGKPT